MILPMSLVALTCLNYHTHLNICRIIYETIIAHVFTRSQYFKRLRLLYMPHEIRVLGGVRNSRRCASLQPDYPFRKANRKKERVAGARLFLRISHL